MKKPPTPTKIETVEEYLARGGKITVIESTPEVPEFKNGYINRDGEAKRKKANRLKAIEEFNAINKARARCTRNVYTNKK